MLCKHSWKVLSDTVTKSKFEVAMEASRGAATKLPWQLSCAERKHIQIVSCSLCGKLKRFVERI
jgi:ribosomal protein L16/L10AE